MNGKYTCLEHRNVRIGDFKNDKFKTSLLKLLKGVEIEVSKGVGTMQQGV